MSQRVTTSPPISSPHNADNASNVVNVAPTIHFSRRRDSHLSHHKHYFILTILGKHSDIGWDVGKWGCENLSTLRNMRYNCWAFETWCSLHWTSTLISEPSASSFDSSRGLKHWSMALTQWWKLMLGTVPDEMRERWWKWIRSIQLSLLSIHQNVLAVKLCINQSWAIIRGTPPSLIIEILCF